MNAALVSETRGIDELQSAALEVCEVWRNNSVETDKKTVEALVEPIANLGMALAKISRHSKDDEPTATSIRVEV